MKEIFKNPAPPYLFQTACTESDLTDSLWSIQSESNGETAVRVFRGKKMKTENELYDEVSAACQFPGYFGYNWDALNECITDLEWLPASSYVFAISNINELILGDTYPIETFLKICQDAGEEWGTAIDIGESWDRPPKGFHLLLHSIPEKSSKVDEWLKAIGRDCPKLNL